MMYGTVETMEERIEHLMRLRDLQDETGGFTAFITWSYQPEHTELGGGEATGVDYLRTLAIARIVLDNFDNLQASWVTQGGKVGQLSLAYGANDMGSVMIEENVVRAAGQLLHGRDRDRPQHRERRLRAPSAATCTTRSSAIRSSASAPCRACCELAVARADGDTSRCARDLAATPRAARGEEGERLNGSPMIVLRAAGCCRSPFPHSRRLGRGRGRAHRRIRPAARPAAAPERDLGDVAIPAGTRQRPHASRTVLDARAGCRPPRRSNGSALLAARAPKGGARRGRALSRAPWTR